MAPIQSVVNARWHRRHAGKIGIDEVLLVGTTPLFCSLVVFVSATRISAGTDATWWIDGSAQVDEAARARLSQLLGPQELSNIDADGNLKLAAKNKRSNLEREQNEDIATTADEVLVAVVLVAITAVRNDLYAG